MQRGKHEESHHVQSDGGGTDGASRTKKLMELGEDTPPKPIFPFFLSASSPEPSPPADILLAPALCSSLFSVLDLGSWLPEQADTTVDPPRMEGAKRGRMPLSASLAGSMEWHDVAIPHAHPYPRRRGRPTQVVAHPR